MKLCTQIKIVSTIFAFIGTLSGALSGMAYGGTRECMLQQLEEHMEKLKAANLRDELPEDFLDKELAAAYRTGTLDLSKAPGEFFKIKSGSLKGRSIHYVDLRPESAGPTKGSFVLIGGLLYHARQWNESGFVDSLRKNGYRVVVIDPPGQGWTLLRHLYEDGSGPGYLKPPQRYEKADQAEAIHELLTALKEKGHLDSNTFLAGESYGGWLTTYIATLPKFSGLIKDIFPLDPGMGNTTHILFGADQWNIMRESIEHLNPYAAMIIPKKMPGSDPYKAAKDLADEYVLDLKNHPSMFVQMSGVIMQKMRDFMFKALMDNFIPEAARTRSPVLYSGAVPLFNGIREFDAPAKAQFVGHPTHLIEAGKNGGIVPHLQHKEFAEGNPNLKGWYRFTNTGHDLPVEAGPQLAQLMMDIVEGKPMRPFKGKRIDINPKKAYKSKTDVPDTFKPNYFEPETPGPN